VRAPRRSLVFLLPLLVYLATGNTLGSSDSLPSRYLPFSILLERDFDLDEFASIREAPHPDSLPAPYYVRVRGGHYVSSFSPGPALLALPVYVLPVLAGVSADSGWPAVLEKLSASLITALSVLWLFLAVKRVSGEGAALVAAAIYAFATSCFSVSSQALWEHGPGQLFVALALWLLAKDDEDSVGAAGLALAAAVLMRPTNVLVAAPLAVSALLRRPRAISRFLLLASPPLVFLAAYDTRYFGAPWSTGRNEILGAAGWAESPLANLPGLLLSPGRGLFVYSPVLVLAVAGLALGCLRRRPLFPALASSAGLLVIGCSLRRTWWAGWCYGPRCLADILPVLCFALVPVLEAARPRRGLRATIAALALLSVGIHALGAFYNDLSWDSAADVDTNPRRLWSWSEGPIPHYARRALWSARRVHAGLRMWLWRFPTSREGSGLAASYVSAEVPGSAPAGGRFPAGVRAFNTGRSVWLPRTGDGRGTVQLAWVWSCDGRALATPAGRMALALPVFPGESFEVRGAVQAPGTPGDCVLSVGLVSEFVTWFSAAGSPALQVPVRVLPGVLAGP